MPNTHCAVFDKANTQYASIINANCPNLNVLADFTFEGWIEIDSGAGDDQFMLLAKHGTTPVDQVQYSFYYENVGVPSLNLDLSFNGANIDSETVAVDLGYTWNHIAVTREKVANEIKFYVNGVKTGATQASTAASDLFSGVAPFVVGGRLQSPWHWMDGRIDGVRVWNDVRTAQELLLWHNFNLIGNETNLQFDLRLNDTWVDASSNAYNLTPAGGASAPTFSSSDPAPIYDVAVPLLLLPDDPPGGIGLL